MKFGLRKGWVILLFVLPFCVSCGNADLLDTDKWSVEGWEPGIKGAIAWGDFELWDFLQDSTKEFRVEMEEDSSLVVRYSKPDIASIDIAEVFQLETGKEIEFEKTLELPATLLKGTESVETYFPEGYKFSPVPDISANLPLPKEFDDSDLSQITLSKGVCTYRLSGFENLKYEITVTYESEGKDSILLEANELSGTSGVVSLEDRTFDLPQKRISLKVDVFLKEGTIAGDLNIQVKFADYDFSKVRGKIVKTGGIKIDDGSFDMDMDILNDIKGTIWFTDPKVELVMRNKGFGVPLGVDMTFVGTDKNGEKVKLALDTSLLFAGNSSDAEMLIIQSVDSANSNIVDFLASLPRGKMNYSGTVTVNPDKKEEDCVIYRNGSLGMDLNVVVPVELKVDSLSYGNTVSNVNIDSKYADKIKEGTISLYVQENGLPLDLSIPQMVLLGERNVPLDTIAAENGGRIKAGEGGELSFEIDEGVAKNLGKTRSILLEAAVLGATEEPVKVKANARLKFALMLEAKAVISDFNDFK